MSEFEERLRGLHPTIEKILSISGSAGASIGILHNGKVAHTDNFRFRDHAQKQSPAADTLYNIGSLTKSMVAQVVGVLVEEGKLSWNTRVSDVISEFQSQDNRSQITAPLSTCLLTGLVFQWLMCFSTKAGLSH
jgi:CubicO group peptidase (beta-lactamase class C family)